MTNEKIALLIDSGTDVPTELLEKDNVFILPLRVIFSDGEYIDKKTINSTELFSRMNEEIPTTSLPSGEDIVAQLNAIVDAGYTAVIAVTISSGLSGTNNFVRNLLEDFSNLKSAVIDTKNISIGSGFTALTVEMQIEAGIPFEEIVQNAENLLPDCKIFFSVNTLEYLRKGGRIGLVSATLGEMLNLKPIISCNEEGVYFTVDKVRGKKKSIAKMVQIANDYAADSGQKYNVFFIYGNFIEELNLMKELAAETIKNAVNTYVAQVGPALGVHVGPDAYGIGIQLLDEKI